MEQHTLAIIKPDAVQTKQIGAILKEIEAHNLQIVAMKMLHLSKNRVEQFYQEHQGKEFYEPLIKFMVSAPIVVAVLKGENAISKYRNLMGKTDFKECSPHTLRRMFAESVRHNAVHGSDSEKSARREIQFFFNNEEILFY